MATSAETYAAALKPYLSAGWYSDMAKTNPFWAKMIPYDKTQFDPKFSIDLMQYYNNKMGLGLTDAQIAAGIQNFGTRHQQQFGTGVTSESNPVAVGAESILRALELAGKDPGPFWSVASQDLGKGQAMADDIYRYTMALGGQEFQANEKEDSDFGSLIDKFAPMVLGAIAGPAGGLLATAAKGAGKGEDFGDILKSLGMSAAGTLIGGGGLDSFTNGTALGNWMTGAGGTAGAAAGSVGDFFGEGTAGATVGTGSGTSGLLGGTTGAAAGAGGTGMFDWLDDAGSWVSDLFGGGGTGAQTLDPSLLGSDAIETMWKISEAQGGIPWTEAATNLGFNSVGSLLGSIDPSWVSTGLSNPTSSAGKLLQSLGAVKADGSLNPQVLSGILSAGGGLLAGNAATDAAETAANAQLEAARIAADAAKFKPVGVTTRFGQSQFTKDAQGNVTDAGYTMPADIKAMQDSLIGAAPGMLGQFTGSMATTAPMGDAAQRMMTLGNSYLATDPQAQAQKYYNDQQAIMATERARQEAGTLTGEFNRGTYGLATGGTGMMGAANPRLEALYNAQRQQDLQAAANATQGGMDYAKFGSTMTGLGGDMLKSMYGTQAAAYNPYATAMTGAQNIEGLGQNALDLSVNMGKVASPAQSGQLLGQGMLGAAQTMQQANQYSPWGTALMNAGNALNTMQQPQQQQTSGYMFNPFTGVRL